MLIEDYINQRKTKIDKIVDETFWELINPANLSVLERQMPAVSYRHAELLLLRMKAGTRPTIASIIAPEQEIPIAANPGLELTQETIHHIKLGKAYVWLETHYRMVDKLRQQGSESGNQSVAADIEKMVFGSLQTLTTSVVEKSVVLAMQIQQAATGSFVDPLTGQRWGVSYADKIKPALTPAPLTGPAAWSAAATCTPLDDLETHAMLWYEEFGMYPREITMRRKTLDYIRYANHTKTQKIAGMGGDNPSVAMIDAIRIEQEEAIDMVKRRTGCDTVTINDQAYSEEMANGEIVNKKYVEENLYYFTEPNNIERAWLPTVENDFRPGIFTVTELLSKAPRRERSAAVGCCVPMVLDPRKIGYQKVA